MMAMLRAFFACLALVVCALAFAPRGPAAVDARQLISLPGVPGLPNPNNVIKGAAVQQAINALDKTIADDEPIRSSADKVYPTVATLPGPAFVPGRIGGRLSLDRNGTIAMSPGDYTLNVQTFCMKYTSHSPQSNIFRLAPLAGKWADIIGAVQARGVAVGVPHQQIQVLSWQLQAGLKYQELSPISKSLIERLIPEYRSRLNESFYEEIVGTWNKVASTIPGTPSLDSMLGQLGDAGQFIRELEAARATLLSYADDYNSIARMFVQPPQAHPEAIENTAWSVISDRLYARMLNPGTFLGPGTLEIRVLPQIHARGGAAYRVASLRAPEQPALADAGAPVPLPAGGDVGVPGAAVQPMGLGPEAPSPGPSPSPSPSCGTAPYGGGNDGVPGGNTTHHPFSSGTQSGGGHPGQDVFAPRDTPVYADLQPTVPAADLNNAGVFHSTGGLNIPETGDLTLQGAKVVVQPWAGTGSWDYGGIVELQAQYQGANGTYQINIDYLHLITKDRHPRNDANQFIDNNGKPIAEDEYKGCMGFGPDITPGASLTRDELARHPLIGYLGATQTAHTHIQATYQGHNFDPAPLLASN